jgi:hypothetical protein
VCRDFDRGYRRFELASTRLLIRLLEALVRRFKRNVSARQRSKFIQHLLEDALPPEDGSDDDSLYQAALAVEKKRALMAEMAEWEAAAIDDGFSDPGRRGWPEIASSLRSSQ